VGEAGRAAFGLPIAFGALGGMVLLEGFLVTTLDTAVRLMRYLLEEVWHTLLDAPAPDAEGGEVGGACGIPPALDSGAAEPAAPPRWRLARWLEHYWVNSALAVGLTLWFAFSSGILSLWSLFATANQLLAAFVLLLGALWLFRRARPVWTALLPALFMLATTLASLRLLWLKFRPAGAAGGGPAGNRVLFGAVVVLLALTVYLLAAGLLSLRRGRAPAAAGGTGGGKE